MKYWVTNLAEIAAIAPVVQGLWRLTEDAAETLNRTFFDTFDWSVYLTGATLEWRSTALPPVLIWSELKHPDDALIQVAPWEPAFPGDLAPGPVQTRLMATAPHRRLLPIMGIQTRVRHLELCNHHDKTVVRLAIKESTFNDPRDGSTGALRPRLQILPVRGHAHEAATLREALAGVVGLEPVDLPLLLEALAAAGRRPADYSSKLDYRLDPAARADLVTKEILLGLLSTLEANLDGARANLDSEFLHDLRVATRRTRAALGQVRGVFPEDLVTHFKEEFTWLQLVTGPIRDLDVYLLDFDTYQRGLPASLGADLEPLRDFLHSYYRREQDRLVQALASQRFTQLRGDWRAFLEAPAAEPATPNGARPIKDLADQRIWALARRVRREGRGIGPDSPPEDLHELRKSCKKLRYLMEFFQSLYPKDQTRTLIARMKVLLDNLGCYQDLAVQAVHLRELAGRMRDVDQAATETLLAMGALIGNLLARQQQAREAFDHVFDEFQSEGNRRAFRNLFRPICTTQPGNQHSDGAQKRRPNKRCKDEPT
ncbi:CHAD domain-containing protein [uncultured Thiodictyon sp.]|uniref:CHAD domain-containing protein n=1 Tax=uncultured Thiodictyon sp. TaxID=1846217 RepID=UPI0025DF156A|nr:CHAD domain-containing protein [uncultured Thiodictyon sp.]